MNNHHHHAINTRNIVFVIFLNFFITIAEIIGGLLSNSLSLISDALHNFSDGIAILISYLALRLGQRQSTVQKTFGYKRAEILAALFNASVLIIIIFFLFKEAITRLFSPHPINSNLMMIVAMIGLVANLIGVFLLKEDAGHNLNIKSAYLHLVADSLSSIAVVIGSMLIKFFNIYIIDPVLTIIIGIYILRESYLIVRDTVNILMQSTPEGIDIMAIKCAIESIPEVHNLHHVHIWQMTDKDIHFEGHIDVCEDYKTSEVAVIIKKVEDLLAEKFGINHTTIQVEFGTCSEKEIIKTC
ncbi:MAG: cation diffusion facilitator family transporter [candidate division WOR-3 bacterium]|nr:cation diffusion facilitator family transporter [candidate division WOR-3 bacterium]